MQNQFVNQNNIQNIPIEMLQNQQMLIYPHQNKSIIYYFFSYIFYFYK